MSKALKGQLRKLSQYVFHLFQCTSWGSENRDIKWNSNSYGELQCPSEKSLWIFRAWAVLQFENHSDGTIIQLKRYFCFARSLHADDHVWSTWDWFLLCLLHNWDIWDGLTCLRLHYQLLRGVYLIPSLVPFTLRWDLRLRGSMVLRLQQGTHRMPASLFTRWLTMGKSLKLWVPH